MSPGLLSDADYDNLLSGASGGETVTLGSTTVPCKLISGDSNELKDEATRKMWGQPVSVNVAAFIVTVRTDALTGLVPGASVTLRGGTYTVDKVQRPRDTNLTHFSALPVLTS